MKCSCISITLASIGLCILSGQAQNRLPGLKYSKEPAVLKGRIIGDSIKNVGDVDVMFTMKYHSGMGDALRGKSVTPEEDGSFEFSLPTGTTVECHVDILDRAFSCYVVPGDTVSFTLDLKTLDSDGLGKALSFDGTLADFNRDLVYAMQKDFDPGTIYKEMERKRNMGVLINELPAKSEEGYHQYLDSVYQTLDRLIDADTVIGEAYRKYAKAVNRYYYGAMIPFCLHAIQYAGIETDEDAAAFSIRKRQRLQEYMQGDPWSAPELSYVMDGSADLFVKSSLDAPVKLPEEYRQCRMASEYLMQIGQRQQILSEEQKDSVRILLPELGQDVLDYNAKLEQELAMINKDGLSRRCSLETIELNDDVLSALIKPYLGRPVLIDLWETTCGPCRMAFKEMHEKKKELADKMHFVNVASENSDLKTWEALVPSYIGDHYRLSKEQLEALHRQLPCPTNGVPIWVLVNADGTIHHAFTGYRNLDSMMKEIAPVLQ